MQPVEFTQYLMPDGRRRKVLIDRDDAVAETAKNLRIAGYHFDIEMLQTGQISMTVEPDKPDANGEDLPIAHEIVTNGPAVLEAVDRLIASAAELVFSTGDSNAAPR